MSLGSLIAEYWPVIAGVVSTSGVWFIAPKVKIKTLLKKQKTEEVKATIDLHAYVERELARMNGIIAQHTVEISELRIKLTDSEIANRMLQAKNAELETQLGDERITNQALAEENGVLKRDNAELQRQLIDCRGKLIP